MSAKLKIPEKGLFGLPSPTRQADNEEISNTQVLENQNTEELNNLRTEEASNFDTSSNAPSTQVLEYQDIKITENTNTQVLENPNSVIPESLSTKQPEERNILTLDNQDTQVPNNPSTQVLKNLNTEQPQLQSTQVLEKSSTKVVKSQDSSVLPKKQKNNRVKDDKKPVRKQASVHLTGATLKALHLYAFDEGLEKSEVVEKALKKFIPKKYFE